MEFSMDFGLVAVLVALVFLLYSGVKIVPQQEAWVIERLGKYLGTLEAGLNIIVPFVDRVAYKHTLKERAVDVAEQTAITNDNVTLELDGVLYLRIINARDASYGIENIYYAVSQLAQTSMRSAIGKMPLDKTFEERETLNTHIVLAINEAASTWGIQCMRYEIRDIKPPITVLKAMELQVAAERQKRAAILDSEGRMQAQINAAEGEKRETVLQSEASYIDQVNRAKGESEAILMVAEATAKGIEKVAVSIGKSGGKDAVGLRVAEQYMDAFKGLAKTNNTMILPANANDAGSMVAQALTIFNTLSKDNESSKAKPKV